jgi:hypothetical protein
MLIEQEVDFVDRVRALDRPIHYLVQYRFDTGQGDGRHKILARFCNSAFI